MASTIVNCVSPPGGEDKRNLSMDPMESPKGDASGWQTQLEQEVWAGQRSLQRNCSQACIKSCPQGTWLRNAKNMLATHRLAT